MRPFLLATLLFAGCSTKQPAASITFPARSSLAEGDCRKATDPADPNDTPYFICPGFFGYTLNVRQVESGRTSLEVTNPDGKTFPLNYQDVIAIHVRRGQPSRMAGRHRERQAHASRPDRQCPGTRRTQARTAKVTHTYIAIAKITPQMVCVTN